MTYKVTCRRSNTVEFARRYTRNRSPVSGFRIIASLVCLCATRYVPRSAKCLSTPLRFLSFKMKKAAEAAFLILIYLETIPLLPYQIHHGLKQCVAGFD